MVVGVLQRCLLTVEHVAAGDRRQHRGHRGLADLATAALAVPLQELGERRDPGGADEVEQLLARFREMLAKAGLDLLARALQLGAKNVGDQVEQPPHDGARPGASLDRADVGQVALDDEMANRALRDGVARADHGLVGQGLDAHRGRRRPWRAAG